MSNLTLYNSLTKKKEKFEPIDPPNVGMYTCGMTVYDYAHIGHGRKYVGDDVLRRTLSFNGFNVNHVQNVTDVGHLVSDADEGEDKLEKGARKHGKTVWEVAKYFTDHFYNSMDKLNILLPDIICKATEHIQEQIDLVKKLQKKGYAYETPDAVYFDVSKFEDYTKLFGQKLGEKGTAVREEVEVGKHKRNPQDFALWMKRIGKHKDHVMHWDSPWGDGFPGWHIECSAMSMKYLGEQFDIHTGGEDHLPVHHPNEIAQSESVSGKSPFVKYWIHHGFLKVEGTKMSKSLGNLFTIEDVEEKEYEPLALRYLYLTAHYRDPLNFTWESLEAAQNALNNLKNHLQFLKNENTRTVLSEEKRQKTQDYNERFTNAINDDLNTAQALAVLWEVLKSNIPSEDKYDLIMTFDEVLGLKLASVNAVQETEIDIPGVDKKIINRSGDEMTDKLKEMIRQREDARKQNDFTTADKIRDELKSSGVIIKDLSDKVVIEKNNI